MNWWWLSFATDDECLGIAIVEAMGMIDATKKCHRLGINPGGQVMGFLVPEESYEEMFSMYEPDKLITVEELKANGEKAIKELPKDYRRS